MATQMRVTLVRVTLVRVTLVREHVLVLVDFGADGKPITANKEYNEYRITRREGMPETVTVVEYVVGGERIPRRLQSAMMRMCQREQEAAIFSVRRHVVTTLTNI
ncbi:hypothetical protein ECANGB1_527, partial [Enterospora canceri]